MDNKELIRELERRLGSNDNQDLINDLKRLSTSELQAVVNGHKGDVTVLEKPCETPTIANVVNSAAWIALSGFEKIGVGGRARVSWPRLKFDDARVRQDSLRLVTALLTELITILPPEAIERIFAKLGTSPDQYAQHVQPHDNSQKQPE